MARQGRREHIHVHELQDRAGHRYRALFDVEPPAGEWGEEVYKDYPPPIVLRDAAGARIAQLATFGIVPRKHIPEGVKGGAKLLSTFTYLDDAPGRHS